MLTHPTLSQRIAFRVSWFLRGIPMLILMAGCASAPAIPANSAPLDACHRYARDIEVVCAHQGPLICDPSVKILCPGDIIRVPL